MALFTDLNSLDGHDDIALALGNMLIAWAAAETAMLFAMCAICGLDINQASLGFYRIPTFEARVKFMLAMIPEWRTETHDKDAIKSTIEAISGLSGTRNNWVHNVWSKAKEDGRVFVFNFRAPADKGRGKPVKAHDIKHHTSKLLEHTTKLRKLLPEQPFVRPPMTSPEKS